jgi:hypothetical protein
MMLINCKINVPSSKLRKNVFSKYNVSVAVNKICNTGHFLTMYKDSKASILEAAEYIRKKFDLKSKLRSLQVTFPNPNKKSR